MNWLLRTGAEVSFHSFLLPAIASMSHCCLLQKACVNYCHVPAYLQSYFCYLSGRLSSDKYMYLGLKEYLYPLDFPYSWSKPSFSRYALIWHSRKQSPWSAKVSLHKIPASCSLRIPEKYSTLCLFVYPLPRWFTSEFHLRTTITSQFVVHLVPW